MTEMSSGGPSPTNTTPTPPPRRSTPPGAASRGESSGRSSGTTSTAPRATSDRRSGRFPFLAILVVLVMAPTLRVLDAWLGWRLSGLSVGGAQALYQTIITLDPVVPRVHLRIAARRDSDRRRPADAAHHRHHCSSATTSSAYSVGLFVFTLDLRGHGAQPARGDESRVVSLLAAMLGIACMATFLFLIDYAARLLRPVSILARVGDEGVR